jgi:hypothetical protein
MLPDDNIFEVQSAVQDDLIDRSNVVGVAVGFKGDKTADTGELAVVVLVERKLPLAALSASDVIPKQIDGVRTDVVEVGYLRAYQSPRGRFRPMIPAGVSIGHFLITAGTLGAIVTDRITGDRLILSNNHVLANSNNAQIGDPILQPGPLDGGQNPGDMVARLERFVRLRFVGDPDDGPLPPTPPGEGGCLLVVANIANALGKLLGSQTQLAPTPKPQTGPISATPQEVANLVDAAVARPLNPAQFSSDILGIGTVSGTKPPMLGLRVRKSGRTTGYTEGRVTLLNATVNIAYGSKTARFVSQIITEPMSQGGDSGSLIVDAAENRAVGLLFAGSTQATIFNPITAVLDALQVNI